jgi:hypothetical protein
MITGSRVAGEGRVEGFSDDEGDQTTDETVSDRSLLSTKSRAAKSWIGLNEVSDSTGTKGRIDEHRNG